jgi:ribosomal protein L4
MEGGAPSTRHGRSIFFHGANCENNCCIKNNEKVSAAAFRFYLSGLVCEASTQVHKCQEFMKETPEIL